MSKEDFVLDSEYLVTLLVIVPKCVGRGEGGRVSWPVLGDHRMKLALPVERRVGPLCCHKPCFTLVTRSVRKRMSLRVPSHRHSYTGAPGGQLCLHNSRREVVAVAEAAIYRAPAVSSLSHGLSWEV